MITSGTRASADTATPSFQAHLYSLAMPRPASAAPTTSDQPEAADRAAEPEQPEHRVDVEQEHPHLQGLGQRRVRPPAELPWLTVWQAWSWPPAQGPGSRRSPGCARRRCARSTTSRWWTTRIDRLADRRPTRSRSTRTTASRRWSSTWSPGRARRCTCRSSGTVRSARPAPSACCASGSTAGRSCVTNADAWLPVDLEPFVDGWDGERIRLLVVEDRNRPDFGSARYCGVALLPWSDVVRPRAAAVGPLRGELALRVRAGPARPGRPRRVPSSTAARPADYLRANLLASGGAPVIGAGAQVDPGRGGRAVRGVAGRGGRTGRAAGRRDPRRRPDGARPVGRSGDRGANGDRRSPAADRTPRRSRCRGCAGPSRSRRGPRALVEACGRRAGDEPRVG